MYFLKSANYQLHTSQGVLVENQPVQSAVPPMLTENSPRPNGAAQICMASWGFPHQLFVTCVQKNGSYPPPGTHSMGLGGDQLCGSRETEG